MRDFPGANGLPPLCVVAFFPPPTARAGVLEPLQKWGWSRFEHTSSLTFLNPGVLPIFFNGSNTLALTGGRRRMPLRIMEANRSLLGSRTSIFTPLENVWKRLMNMLMSWEKQGGKNPRKIPKFSINHERSSRTIEKKSKITPTHSSYGILNENWG